MSDDVAAVLAFGVVIFAVGIAYLFGLGWGMVSAGACAVVIGCIQWRSGVVK
jgi:hypothetical protein